jgi:hypothetical protein
MRKGIHHSESTRQKMRAHNKSKNQDLVASFWSRVNKNGPIPEHVPHLGPCWEWTGGFVSGKFPYGVLTVNGKTVLAHRFAYALEKGPIPTGKCVLHSCDNVKCLRGSHLYLGTRIDNNLDRDRKHRQAHSEKNSHAKLTAAEIDTLRWTYRIGGVSQATLALWYGISAASVNLIVHNKNWRLPLAA